MINCSGLTYRIFAVGLIIAVLGLLIILFSRFWNMKTIDTKTLITGVVILILGIAYISFLGYKTFNPNVLEYEGVFVREYRNSSVAPPLPFTSTYVFDDGSGKLKPGFHLDSFSKKKIYNLEFEEEQRYLIYYEKDTKIILGVSTAD